MYIYSVYLNCVILLAISSFKQEMFQKHICPPWCKIQNYYLYIQGMGLTPAPILVMIKCRGQKISSGQHTGLEIVV